MTILLRQVWEIQKRYGEDAETFTMKDKGFQWLLEDYSIVDIKWAFKKYMDEKDDFPAPANITRLIRNRGSKPHYTIHTSEPKTMEELLKQHGARLPTAKKIEATPEQLAEIEKRKQETEDEKEERAKRMQAAREEIERVIEQNKGDDDENH